MMKVHMRLQYVYQLAMKAMAFATIFMFAGSCKVTSPTQTFGGIGSAQVISPTTVRFTWTVTQGYSRYEIYSSASAVPIGSTKFGNYTVMGLSPNTLYEFCVAGVSQDGGLDGMDKNITVQTWPHFSGIEFLTATSPTTIEAAWSYPYSVQCFDVYVNPGSTPTDFSTPAATTVATTVGIIQLANGTAIQPNTTYYVIVRATYLDGTKENNGLVKIVTTPPFSEQTTAQ